MRLIGDRSERRPAVPHAALVAALATTACGTDVQALLEAEAQMTWQASEVVNTAQYYDPTLAEPVERAEAAKVEACQDITQALQRRIRGEAEERSDLGDDIVAGLEEFMAWALPIGPVEDCADAQEQYRQSILDLERRLQTLRVGDEPPA